MSRTYTEREIAALLARAAERQQAAPAAAPAPGLTLDEIERAARDAGLDPAHLRAAAAELDAGRLGAPTAPGVVTLERWVDTPLTDAGWEEAVGALRTRFGASTHNGWTAPVPDTARVGAAHEWTHASLAGITTTVTVSPRGDRTRVRLTQTESMALSDRATAFVYAGLPMILAALLSGGLTDHLGAGPLTAAGVALAVLVVGTWVGTALVTPSVQRSRARRVGRAADALDYVVRCLGVGVLPGDAERGGTTRDAAPRLDLDAQAPEADDAAFDTPDVVRRRTHS